MTSNLHKRVILDGLIDSFCLVCECHIKGKSEENEHITSQHHLKNLKSVQVVEKYKDDHILKIKQGYFCVYCNTVFTTATKVTLHVTELGHRYNRGAHFLRREGESIIFQDIIVDARAWSGLVGEMCAVCNAEVEDDAAHVRDPAHVYNLVRNPVEFGPKKEIYRKVDDTTFQCITCNTVMCLQALSTHFDDPKHNDLLQKCANAYCDLKQKQRDEILQPKNKLAVVTEMEKDNQCNIEKDKSSSSSGLGSAKGSGDELDDIEAECTREEKKAKILDSVVTFEKNEVNINFVTETAICKKCLGNVDFDHRAIEKHIDQHKRNPKQRDVGYVPFQCEVNMKVTIKLQSDVTGTDRSRLLAIDSVSAHAEVKTKSRVDINHNDIGGIPNENVKTAITEESPSEFAKSNQITFNKGNYNAYCRLCSTRLPSSLKSMKEHVAGHAHKKRLNATQPPEPRQSSRSSKITMEDYINETYTIRNLIDSDTVVNDKFCMEDISFHLTTRSGARLRCQVCELSFYRDEFDNHKKSPFHRLVLLRTNVVTKYDGEFVREVRPDLFHCAFCNLLEVTEQNLGVHFASDEHRARRALYSNRLQRHRPAIREHRMEQQFFMHMLFAGSRGFF